MVAIKHNGRRAVKWEARCEKSLPDWWMGCQLTVIGFGMGRGKGRGGDVELVTGPSFMALLQLCVHTAELL